MKKFVSVLALFLFVAAMAFAGGGKDSGSSGPVSIKLGTWPSKEKTAEIKVNEQQLADFSKKYPNIKASPASYTYAYDTFLPLAASNQLPTVIEVWFTEPAKIADAGYANDITSVVQKLGYDKIMNPSVKDILSKDGKIYGIPRDGYALGLYINMNIFKQAGLLDKDGLPIYPKTMDELAQTAQIIKQKTGKAGMYIATKDHVGGWHFTNIAWNFGAQFEVKKNGKWVAQLNSPEVVAAMNWVKDLKWKYDVLLPNTLLGWGEWIQNYGTDQVGMVLAAADVVNLPVNDYKMSKDAIAIVPIPKGPTGKQYSLLGGTYYSFFGKPAEVEGAFRWLEEIGKLPVLTDANLQGIEDDLKIRAQAGQPIGPQSLQVWNKPDYQAAKDKLYAKYTNVNMKLFQDYYKVSQFNLKTEEPVATQDLYGELDNVLQVVLNNKNADVKALLDEANARFQKQFLDKATE